MLQRRPGSRRKSVKSTNKSFKNKLKRKRDRKRNAKDKKRKRRKPRNRRKRKRLANSKKKQMKRGRRGKQPSVNVEIRKTAMPATSAISASSSQIFRH